MQPEPPSSGRDWRTVLRGAMLLGSLAVFGLLLQRTHVGAMFGPGWVDAPAWIDAEVRGHGVAGELLFVCVAGMLTAVGVPRQLVSFLGGYAFGLVFGTVLAVAATLLGCAASFYCARVLGRAYLARRFSGRVRRFDDFIRAHPLGMTLLIRLSPVGNNLLTNLLAGVTSVRPSLFFAASAVGYIPQSLAFALGGSGVEVDPLLRTALAVILFLVSGALGAWLLRKFRRGPPLDFDTESELTYASGPRA
ncbi:MAG TPA: VTT domain-containing protein [Burkholderiales bacterium]|nr:VTT domain-containing protein [Burkholderiales bacterium]